MPEVETGNYRIAVQLKLANGDPIVKLTTVHIERGLGADFAAAKSRAAKVKATLERRRQDSLLAVLPTAEYRVSQFELATTGEISGDRVDFRDTLREANSILDKLSADNDPFSERRGEFKKAYLSKVDNTLQPYQIFVPSRYDKSMPVPLVIALHGMGGDENSYLIVYGQGAFKAEAEKRGYIVACPKGRKPASMYVGDAERDVMDVLAEVRRAYNINPDRIFDRAFDGRLRYVVYRHEPSRGVRGSRAGGWRVQHSAGHVKDCAHPSDCGAWRQRCNCSRRAVEGDG